MDTSPETPPAAERARKFAPVVWLLDKVQSGKTSIIRELRQANDAEMGSGFEACIKTARVFDFPAEAPIVRFLDTRDLGEVAYDAAEDITFSEGRANLLLAVTKALDFQQQAVPDAIRAARVCHPSWPIVVAQTSLHEAYPPGARHMLDVPYNIDALWAKVMELPEVQRARLLRTLEDIAGARSQAANAVIAGTLLTRNTNP